MDDLEDKLESLSEYPESLLMTSTSEVGHLGDPRVKGKGGSAFASVKHWPLPLGPAGWRPRVSVASMRVYCSNRQKGVYSSQTIAMLSSADRCRSDIYERRDIAISMLLLIVQVFSLNS